MAAGEQAADSGRIHLDAEEVTRGFAVGECNQGFASTEPDLHRPHRRTAEEAVEVERFTMEFNQVPFTELVQSPALRRGHAPGPDDEASYRTPPHVVFGVHVHHPCFAAGGRPIAGGSLQPRSDDGSVERGGYARGALSSTICGSPFTAKCILPNPRLTGPGNEIESCSGQSSRYSLSGCSSMVEPQLPKLMTWVRFPSPAPSTLLHPHHQRIVVPVRP